MYPDLSSATCYIFVGRPFTDIFIAVYFPGVNRARLHTVCVPRYIDHMPGCLSVWLRQLYRVLARLASHDNNDDDGMRIFNIVHECMVFG